MATFIAAVFLAFALYVVILPLVGMVSGFLLLVAMPYLLGGIIVLFVLDATGSLSELWFLIPVVALAWAVPVLVVRTSKCLRSIGHLGWHEGHYLSAFRLLTIGTLTAVETADGHPWRLNRKTAVLGH